MGDLKITVIGRGNVGGGFAERWRCAGHEVTELGKDGGDASDAEVLLIAVPSGAVAGALGKSFATHARDLAPSGWGAKEA